MASILKEIRIFEAGQHTDRRTSSMSTTSSFYMGANRGGTHKKHKKDPSCVFCKGMHKPNLCTIVSCPKACLAVVNADLYFNCLARHKVSQCPSKFTCRECRKKYHTSLCHAFTTPIEPSLGSQPTLAVTTSTDQVPPPTVTTTAQTVSATTQSEGTPTATATTSLSAISTSV